MESIRRAVTRALVSAGAIALLATASSALEPPPAPGQPTADAPRESVPDAGVPVKLDGQEVFRLYGGYVGTMSVQERRARAEAILLRLADDPFYSESMLTLRSADEGAWIDYRGEPVALVDRTSPHLRGRSPEFRAAEIIDAVEQAIGHYRERREPAEWTRSILLLLGATLALALAIRLVLVAQRRLSAHLEDRGRSGRVLGGDVIRLGDSVRFAAFEVRVLRLVRVVVVVVLVLVYLQVAFAIVPLTRGYALRVIQYLLDPLRVIWQSLLANVGNLFFVAVMVVVARLTLRLLRMLFGEVSRGSLSLPGVTQERALPLYKIMRIAVVAITAVVVYPYIPGSNSAAFEGISLFAGALFTLGASSTAGNFIGGIVLVFSGAFRVGDRVRIGDVTGDVEESTLVLTRVRTPKNELVTLANSTVLAQSFVNYSALARRQGVIVHTRVALGYNVPWRTIHELLLRAAQRTDGIVEQPAPFVLQTSLDDFHVSYEINAYTRQANAMRHILSELHQNIQDAFGQAGVEILSPTYAALRDGNVSTVSKPPSTN